mgnify:CR=1 FL=1
MEILWNTEAEAIKGDGAVESLLLQDHVTGEKKEISLQGVFIAVGIQPETAAFEGVVDMEQGYIKAGEEGITSVPGIYAAGDVRTKICAVVSSGRRCQCSDQRRAVSVRLKERIRVPMNTWKKLLIISGMCSLAGVTPAFASTNLETGSSLAGIFRSVK